MKVHSREGVGTAWLRPRLKSVVHVVLLFALCVTELESVTIRSRDNKARPGKKGAKTDPENNNATAPLLPLALEETPPDLAAGEAGLPLLGGGSDGGTWAIVYIPSNSSDAAAAIPAAMRKTSAAPSGSVTSQPQTTPYIPTATPEAEIAISTPTTTGSSPTPAPSTVLPEPGSTTFPNPTTQGILSSQTPVTAEVSQTPTPTPGEMPQATTPAAGSSTSTPEVDPILFPPELSSTPTSVPAAELPTPTPTLREMPQATSGASTPRSAPDLSTYTATPEVDATGFPPPETSSNPTPVPAVELSTPTPTPGEMPQATSGASTPRSTPDLSTNAATPELDATGFPPETSSTPTPVPAVELSTPITPTPKEVPQVTSPAADSSTPSPSSTTDLSTPTSTPADETLEPIAAGSATPADVSVSDTATPTATPAAEMPQADTPVEDTPTPTSPAVLPIPASSAFEATPTSPPAEEEGTPTMTPAGSTLPSIQSSSTPTATPAAGASPAHVPLSSTSTITPTPVPTGVLPGPSIDPTPEGTVAVFSSRSGGLYTTPSAAIKPKKGSTWDPLLFLTLEAADLDISEFDVKEFRDQFQRDVTLAIQQVLGDGDIRVVFGYAPGSVLVVMSVHLAAGRYASMDLKLMATVLRGAAEQGLLSGLEERYGSLSLNHGAVATTIDKDGYWGGAELPEDRDPPIQQEEQDDALDVVPFFSKEIASSDQASANQSQGIMPGASTNVTLSGGAAVNVSATLTTQNSAPRSKASANETSALANQAFYFSNATRKSTSSDEAGLNDLEALASTGNKTTLSTPAMVNKTIDTWTETYTEVDVDILQKKANETAFGSKDAGNGTVPFVKEKLAKKGGGGPSSGAAETQAVVHFTLEIQDLDMADLRASVSTGESVLDILKQNVSSALGMLSRTPNKASTRFWSIESGSVIVQGSVYLGSAESASELFVKLLEGGNGVLGRAFLDQWGPVRFLHVMVRNDLSVMAGEHPGYVWHEEGRPADAQGAPKIAPPAEEEPALPTLTSDNPEGVDDASSGKKWVVVVVLAVGIAVIVCLTLLMLYAVSHRVKLRRMDLHLGRSAGVETSGGWGGEIDIEAPGERTQMQWVNPLEGTAYNAVQSAGLQGPPRPCAGRPQPEAVSTAWGRSAGPSNGGPPEAASGLGPSSGSSQRSGCLPPRPPSNPRPHSNLRPPLAPVAAPAVPAATNTTPTNVPGRTSGTFSISSSPRHIAGFLMTMSRPLGHSPRV